MTSPGKLRELRSAAAQATDARLFKLVQMLDAMPQRGEADTLLDGARPRLRHLRPKRPMKLSRLLFMPLDALIVQPRDWKPGLNLVPRTAIAPMESALRAAEPRLADELDQRLVGIDSGTLGSVQEHAARLWRAATVLPSGIPPGWKEAGLPDHVVPEIAKVCTTLWRHGEALLQLRLEGADGPPESLARPAFRIIAADGAEVVELCLRAVLPYAAAPAQLAAIVVGLNAALARPCERALDQYLEGTSPHLDAADLGAAATAAARFASLLEDLDRLATRDKPRRAQHLQALRRSAAVTCTERLRSEVVLRLTDPLAALLSEPSPTDAAVASLERAAIALRSLAAAVRRLHTSSAPDVLFEATLDLLTRQVRSLPDSGPGFRRADALRLVQILAGPSLAARLLRA